MFCSVYYYKVDHCTRFLFVRIHIRIAYLSFVTFYYRISNFEDGCTARMHCLYMCNYSYLTFVLVISSACVFDLRFVFLEK